MLDGGEDVLRRQRLEVLAGVMLAEPTQHAAGAQENAFARLRLKPPHPAQILRKRGQKRSVRVIYYAGY